MTKTAAYNANEVAAVYMSLNRSDLLSDAEGGNLLQGDESLKNGFFGLSDPLNSRGVLQMFECNFKEGGSKSIYKIRLLNPTPQLETTLLNFYSEVFPSDSSTFTSFKDATEQQERFKSVTGEERPELLSNNRVSAVPTFYLRWGYGTNVETGLSRIHKVQVTDIKYMVNDKEDKVIELYAADLFSHMTGNPALNKRHYVARTQVTDEGPDGKLSFKKPSDILTDIFANYLGYYPQCVPCVDYASYAQSIDNVVYSVAKALAKGDAISETNKRLKEAELTSTQSEEVAAEDLTAEDIKAFEDLLDRPLVTTKGIDRSAVGNVTPQILYQAFKMVFEAIGMKWEMNPVGSPAPITAPKALNQTTDDNTNPEKDLEDQTDVSNRYTTQVNIVTEWLTWGLLPDKTIVRTMYGGNLNAQFDNQRRLSFWPMALENGQVRPLTQEEKDAHSEWRIWLTAGMVNTSNYQTGIAKGDDFYYKYSFPFAELQGKFNVEENTTHQPIPVCVPPSLLDEGAFYPVGGNVRTISLVGNQNSVEWIPFANRAPVIDLTPPLSETDPGYSIDRTTGSFLWVGGNSTTYFAALRAELSPGMSTWMDNVAELAPEVADFLDRENFPSSKVQNPPLVMLEPTDDTALWITSMVANYEANIVKKQEATQKLVEDAKEFLSPVLDRIPEVSAEVKFRRFIDRFANAYVSMGDDGENPHISSFLQVILNNINRLLIGKSSKMRVEQVQIDGLSTEDKEALSSSCTLFKNVTWEEVWATTGHSLLLCMPGNDMSTQYGDEVLKQIHSFPQTYSVDVGKKYIWLDYGTPDSIIADVDFTGETRPLTNLAQSNFSVRQWNDIRQLFDGNKTISTQFLTNVISEILAKKIALLKSSDSTESMAQQKKNLEELERTKTLADTQSSQKEINKELLDLLPSLVEGYQVDAKTGEDDLSELEVITPNSAAQLRMLCSLIGDARILNFLFPMANVEGRTNTHIVETLMVKDGSVRSVTQKIPILKRQIDLDDIRSRMSEDERSRKMTDVAYNYSVAMQQEVFNLRLTILGIPEIDDPASEYLSRRVCFKFYDPRLGNNQLHWMSGVYQILGFGHKINPSQGYLTELEMVKLPNESLSNIRDMR